MKMNVQFSIEKITNDLHHKLCSFFIHVYLFLLIGGICLHFIVDTVISSKCNGMVSQNMLFAPAILKGVLKTKF